MGWIIVNSELISDAVALANTMQRDPWARSVSQVIVPCIARRPSGHRALFDSVNQVARFHLAQQRYELTLEHREVGVHSNIGISAYKAAYRAATEQYSGIEHTQHEVIFTLTYRWIRGEHVVEVGEVRQSHCRCLHCRGNPAGARSIERAAQVQRVCYRI